MLELSWAGGVAALHLTAIGFLLTGGLLAWRWRRLLWVHVPLAAAVLAVNLAHADCPLTTLELRLRQANGATPYTDGFIGHYLVTPVHAAGITPRVQVGIYLVAVMPNVVAYAVLTRAARRRRLAGAHTVGAGAVSVGTASAQTVSAQTVSTNR